MTGALTCTRASANLHALASCVGPPFLLALDAGPNFLPSSRSFRWVAGRLLAVGDREGSQCSVLATVVWERFPYVLEPSPSEARFSCIPPSRQIFPNKIDAAHADVFSRSAALIFLAIFEVCRYGMSEEDRKAPHHTTLKSFDEDPKPQLLAKFLYVGDMKVSAKGGFFVWRHVDQSEERSHGRVHLGQSRGWRG